MMDSSDFITPSNRYTSYDGEFETITPLTKQNGTTALAYAVRMNGKQFFMKQLKPEYMRQHSYRTLFFKEYELGRRISSNRIAKYERIDENDEGLYLLAEYVEGKTLEEKITDEPEYFHNRKNVRKLFTQMLEGLKALHEMNVAHLDLKPDNVMLTQVNNDVKIIDLGFAFHSSYSHTVGFTPRYASPEQSEKRINDVDERSDIYAAGMVMKNIAERTGAKFDKNIQKVIAKCIKTEKNKRYACANDVIEAINKPYKRKRNLIVLLITLCIAIPSCLVLNRMNWFMELKELVAWTLSPSLKDAEYLRVHYQIKSEQPRTCAVVGGDWHPNAMIAKRVTINNKNYEVTEIDDSAYLNAKHLKSIYIPESIKRIGSWGMARCENISLINMPESVQEIGEWAFSYCTSLNTVKLSPALKNIPHGCFCHNYNLKNVHIPEGVNKLGVDAFACCDKLSSVSLPSTLVTIERGVFYQCTALTEISIPASVRQIGEFTFFHCNNLKNVYIFAVQPPQVSRIFMDNAPQLTIHVPPTAVDAYRKAEHWKDYLIVPM